MSLFELFISKYQKGKSYLISAPTGTGKTHIAKHLLNEEGEGIKVYISPLKALSREVYNSIKRRAKYVDSDVYEDDLRNLNAEVLLTTYEKFDSSIRHNYGWLNDVSLLIIDEVHNVESDRGLAIENAVLWAKYNNIPIVALSATIGDVTRYAGWLKAELIQYNQRSVPLHECIAYPYVIRCYDNNTIFALTRRGLRNVKLDLLLGVLDQVLSMNKNALVFTRSRNSAENLAETLKKFNIPAEPYHSGLAPEVRKRVLDDFYSGRVRVLVSTTALGQGVNLPVFAVVFYDLTLPDTDEKGNFKGWRELDLAEFKQIAGRAGRPSFDKEGYAIVIADSGIERIRSKYFAGGTKREDKEETPPYTLPNLTLGVVSWLEGQDEGIISDVIKGSFRFPQADVTSAINQLEKENLITVAEGNVELTPLGKAVALSYIDVEALKGFPVNLQDFDPLDVVSSSPAVLSALRGCGEGKELLKRWVSGEGILDLCPKLSAKDLEEVLSNARWISFALYRVLKALNHGKSEDALKLYKSLKYGVPPEGFDLASHGVHRGLVMKLLKMGVKSADELCVVSPLIKLDGLDLSFCTPYLRRLSQFVAENYGKEVDDKDYFVKRLKSLGVITEEGKWKEYNKVLDSNG